MERLILILALCWPAIGQSQFFNGNDLMEWCDGTKTNEPNASTATYNACVGFLAGVSDASDTWRNWRGMKTHICVPHAATTEQLRQVLLAYMRQRPEDWHMNAGHNALKAFQQAWPCAE